MSAIAISPTKVRRAWSQLDELPIMARRVGRALAELLRWQTWASEEPVGTLDPGAGISRRQIAELADCSPRSVSRGLAELALSGLLTIRRRRWLASWYQLDAAELVRLAQQRREGARVARVAALLSSGAESPEGVASASGGLGEEGNRQPAPRTANEGLERARERLGDSSPSWAARHPRPRDLAALVEVWATTLHADQTAAYIGLYAPRIAALWARVGQDVDELARQLAAVAAMVREGIPAARDRYLSPWEALRPRRWAQLVGAALARHPAPAPAASQLAAIVDEVLAGGAPRRLELDDLVLRWGHRRGLRGPQLVELREALAAHVVDEPDEDVDEDVVNEELAVRGLAGLLPHVAEVEELVAELAALPELPGLPPLTAGASQDPERRALHRRRLLRADVQREASAWLSRARAVVEADEASPATLDDLAAALARLRELRTRLS